MEKKYILRKIGDFKKIYKKGNSFANKYLVVFYLDNKLDYNRIGFLASKKVGKSVIRNRARRLMKECYKNYKDKMVKGYDIIFIARVNIKDVGYKEVDSAFKHILKKTNFL